VSPDRLTAVGAAILQAVIGRSGRARLADRRLSAATFSIRGDAAIDLR
jgi:hypothetical protein